MMKEDRYRSSPDRRLVEGRHIRLCLYARDWPLLRNPGKWVEFLDDLYDTLTDLVGTDPYPDRILEIREVAPFNAWARMGNPIRWNSNGVPEELRLINAGDVGWGIPHEISHDFDVRPACQYYVGDVPAINSEQWANLRLVYAFEKLSNSYPNATSYIGNLRRIPIAKIGTEYFVQRYAQPFISSRTTDWRNMNNDVFSGLLYVVKQDIGWEPFRQTFHDYQIRTFPRDLYETDERRISLLVTLLSNHAKQDLFPRFQQWGFPITWVEPKEI